MKSHFDFSVVVVKSKTSQTKIATALGVTQQYVSKLAKQGMPTDSIAAAQAWVKEQAETAKTAPEPGTLTEGRLRKVLLECRLLQAKIDRELDSSELMPTSQLEAAMTFILSMTRHSITAGSGEIANAVHGLSLQDAYQLIRDAGQNALLSSLEAFVNNSALDPRLKRLAAQSIAESHYQLPKETGVLKETLTRKAGVSATERKAKP